MPKGQLLGNTVVVILLHNRKCIGDIRNVVVRKSRSIERIPGRNTAQEAVAQAVEKPLVPLKYQRLRQLSLVLHMQSSKTPQ